MHGTRTHSECIKLLYLFCNLMHPGNRHVSSGRLNWSHQHQGLCPKHLHATRNNLRLYSTQQATIIQEEDVGYPAVMYPPAFAQMPPPSPPPPMPVTQLVLDSALARQSASEQEMEDGDEDGEWAIRVGNAPPPAWAKRRRDVDVDGPNKKPRMRWVFSGFQ